MENSDASLNDSKGRYDMDAEIRDDILSSLPNEDDGYKLVGALVHTGVTQGGHYCSFSRRPS